MCLTSVPNFNKVWIFLTNFRRSPSIKLYNHPSNGSYTDICGQKPGMTKLIDGFCNCVNVPTYHHMHLERGPIDAQVGITCPQRIPLGCCLNHCITVSCTSSSDAYTQPLRNFFNGLNMWNLHGSKSRVNTGHLNTFQCRVFSWSATLVGHVGAGWQCCEAG